MWATELGAAGHDVWVITREVNRSAIEAELEARRRPGLRFVYYDLPRWVRRLKRGARGVHWYYVLWQWGAYRVASRLKRAVPFDCVHHVTFVGLRGPSFMGWLGLAFYLGPVSGGESVPGPLRAGMSWQARCREMLRDVANRLIHADPIMRGNFRLAEKILLATQASYALIPSMYRGKCSVHLGVGLSPEYLAWTNRRHTVRDRTLRLLYAGRLLEWKGVDLALPAVAAVRHRGVPVQFTIVGSGPAEPKLKRLATELDMEEAVCWIKWMPRDQLHEMYRRHDVLLFPSLRDSGGMVVLEALAHGLPVICTDCGGPGVIVNDQCGRVVRSTARTRKEVVNGLTEAVWEISRNRVLLKKLSAGARARAWEFDFRKSVEQLYPTAASEAAKRPMKAAFS